MGEENFCSGFIFRINLDFHERPYNEQCYTVDIFYTYCVRRVHLWILKFSINANIRGPLTTLLEK